MYFLPLESRIIRLHLTASCHYLNPIIHLRLRSFSGNRLRHDSVEIDIKRRIVDRLVCSKCIEKTLSDLLLGLFGLEIIVFFGVCHESKLKKNRRP